MFGSDCSFFCCYCMLYSWMVVLFLASTVYVGNRLLIFLYFSPSPLPLIWINLLQRSNLQTCWACFYVLSEHPVADPGNVLNHTLLEIFDCLVVNCHRILVLVKLVSFVHTFVYLRVGEAHLQLKPRREIISMWCFWLHDLETIWYVLKHEGNRKKELWNHDNV